MVEHFRAAGGDPHLLEPVLGVDPDYLRTALDEMNQRFGSIEAYFEEGLGIDSDAQRQLRDTLVGSSERGVIDVAASRRSSGGPGGGRR